MCGYVMTYFHYGIHFRKYMYVHTSIENKFEINANLTRSPIHRHPSSF